MKLPEMSLNPPTSKGETNMPNPAAVIMNPQTIATFSGVIPGSSMGRDNKVGTYNQEPIPKVMMDKYMPTRLPVKNEAGPPKTTRTPETMRNPLFESNR
jgi:hypothetical protein